MPRLSKWAGSRKYPYSPILTPRKTQGNPKETPRKPQGNPKETPRIPQGNHKEGHWKLRGESQKQILRKV